jgi:hypothetical protein
MGERLACDNSGGHVFESVEWLRSVGVDWILVGNDVLVPNTKETGAVFHGHCLEERRHIEPLEVEKIVEGVDDDKALFEVPARQFKLRKDLLSSVVFPGGDEAYSGICSLGFEGDKYNIDVARHSPEYELLDQWLSALVEIIEDQSEWRRVSAETKNATHEVEMVALILSCGDGSCHAALKGVPGTGTALLANSTVVTVVPFDPILAVAGPELGGCSWLGWTYANKTKASRVGMLGVGCEAHAVSGFQRLLRGHLVVFGKSREMVK